MDGKLAQILVCPETKIPLRMAEPEKLREINFSIEQGSMRNKKGDAVKEGCDAALIREDGKVAYPIRAGIPVMLSEQALVL